MITVELTKRKDAVYLWGKPRDFIYVHERLWTCFGSDAEPTPEEMDSYIGAMYFLSREMRRAIVLMRRVKLDGKRLRMWDMNDKVFRIHASEPERFDVGVRFDWPYIMFIMTAWWECYRRRECPQELLPVMLDLQRQLEDALKSVCKKDEYQLVEPYLHGAIFAGNPHFVHAMNEAHFRYMDACVFRRTTMKRLAELLTVASYGTDKYRQFYLMLKRLATRERCSTYDINIDYESMLPNIQYYDLDN